MIKIGDKVYCHTEHIVKHIILKDNYSFTKDLLYRVVYIRNMYDSIYIICNEGDTICFDYPEEYNKYFFNIKQMRKKKLEQLEKSYA